MMESYLIKSSLILALFYLFYRFLLSKGANSQTKRFVGLICLMVSSCFFIIPNISIGVDKNFPITIQNVVEGSANIQETFSQTIPKESTNILLTFYFIGVALFSLRAGIGIIHLAKLYFNSDKNKKWGFNVVIVDKQISPFTYFNLLFIGKDDIEKDEKSPLIIHEQFHRDQLHSLDNLLLEIVTIVYWFNPIVWLFKKEIKSQHEFMADEQVLSKGFDKLEYQKLLFNERTGVSFQVVNYLSNQTSLKQRFIMMEKTTNSIKNNAFRIASFAITITTVLMASSFSPVLLENLNLGSEPTFKVYTEDGGVDLEKGVSKDTDKLYIRVISPLKESKASFRVSKSDLTHVSGGLGQAVAKGRDVLDLEALSSVRKIKSGDLLVLQVNEYMTKDENDVVKTVVPEKMVFMTIPVY